MAWAAGDLYSGSAGKAAECSASSEFSGTYPATKAFDGATATDADDCWISTAANPPAVDGSCYLQWAFAARTLIAGIQLRRRDAAATTNFPNAIKVYASDTGAFAGEQVLIGDLTQASPSDGAWGDELTLTPWFCNYLRVEIHSMYLRGDAADWVAVKEVRFKGWVNVGDIPVWIADLGGNLVPEVSGTTRDHGYLGVYNGVNSVPLKYREVKNTTYTPDFQFSKPTSRTFRIRQDYSRGEAFVLARYPATEVNGKKLYLQVQVEAGELCDFRVELYDGDYDVSSDVDFPTSGINPDTAPTAKGVGRIAIIKDSPTGDVRTETIEYTLNTSTATQTYVTILIRFQSGNYSYYFNAKINYWVVSDAGINFFFGDLDQGHETAAVMNPNEISAEMDLGFEVDAAIPDSYFAAEIDFDYPEPDDSDLSAAIDLGSFDVAGDIPQVYLGEFDFAPEVEMDTGPMETSVDFGFEMESVLMEGNAFSLAADFSFEARGVSGMEGGADIDPLDLSASLLVGRKFSGASDLSFDVAGAGVFSASMNGAADFQLPEASGVMMPSGGFRGAADFRFEALGSLFPGRSFSGGVDVFPVDFDGRIDASAGMAAAIDVPFEVAGAASLATATAQAFSELLRFHRGV